jgi:RNA polymerase sigma factor (sigma-70 family)
MENLKSLIKKAQDGDLEAFGRIVRRFQDMAVSYAYSILGDFHLAEDAAQEAFIETYCCLSGVSNPDTFPGWFRKIVFKQCDRITRGKRVETVPLEAAAGVPSREKGPAETVLEQELKDSVLAAIQALPEKQRIVTMLFYINGYSQNEISDFLEIPVTTVKKRLQYSRKRLKERMISMVQDTLYEKRPSRDEQFVNTVSWSMVGSIAKELRKPLGVISSTAQFLLTPPDDTKVYNESVQRICAEVQHALLMIENLLTFAGAEEKKMREIDLHAVLEEAFSLLTSQMALQKVTLQKKLQANLPMVWGSPEPLQQVFANLILNACNAMPQGGMLTVTTRATEATEVEIQFSDTGEGIPPKYLPNIFHPFFTTRQEGMGLGLSSSYSIVQQHQGAIEVESQMGKGTTFIVTLPIRQKVKSQ